MSVSQLLIFARVFKSPLRIDNKIYVVLRSLDPFAEFHLSNCCLGFISYVLLLLGNAAFKEKFTNCYNTSKKISRNSFKFSTERNLENFRKYI